MNESKFKLNSSNYCYCTSTDSLVVAVLKKITDKRNRTNDYFKCIWLFVGHKLYQKLDEK